MRINNFEINAFDKLILKFLLNIDSPVLAKDIYLKNELDPILAFSRLNVLTNAGIILRTAQVPSDVFEIVPAMVEEISSKLGGQIAVERQLAEEKKETSQDIPKSLRQKTVGKSKIQPELVLIDTFECEICNETFSSEQELNGHKWEKHNPQPVIRRPVLTEKVESYLQEILQKVKEGKVILFLGAGASIDAGGPTGDSLVEGIKEQFPKVGQDINNLLDVCQDVVDTPPYDKQQLEDYVVGILDSLKPTETHNKITEIDWSVLFTTNYDNLIEMGYQLSPNRLKPCYTIKTAEFNVNLADRSRVYLFKIMGCMSQRGQKDGFPILTRSDFNSSLLRSKFLVYLFDILKSGTIVFAGYSGKDRIVFELYDELISKIGLDRLPYSYIILPREISEKELHQFSQRKMLHVHCTLDDFIDYVKNNYENPPSSSLAINPLRLNIAGQILELEELNPHIYRDHFTLLNEDIAREDPGDQDDFFRGTNQSFGAFALNWDFQREIYFDPSNPSCLKLRVAQELKKTSPDDNRVLVIQGMGGVGKSFMLRRLAYDAYKQGIAPVIFIDSNRFSFDFKLLDNVLQRLSQQFIEKFSEEKHQKALILIDDAPSQVFDSIKLKNYLASRSRSAVIVIAGRENEFGEDIDSILNKVQEGDVFRINENLTPMEKEKIEEHLLSLGYITEFQTWDRLVDGTIEDSFFATMYALVDPSQKPLNQIISDQFLKLHDFSKEIFQKVCCFHQFNLPINEELLFRLLDCSYPEFFDTLDTELKGLIYSREDSSGTRLYSTHHRIIARKTMEFFFGDSEIQKEMFLDLLSDIHFSNNIERELIRRLMISFIGPHGKGSIFSNSQKREIFQIICQQGPPRSIVHHWGLLEMDDGQFEKSEELLKKALALPRMFEESYRGESNQNILTSLGNLYSRKGIELLHSGETENVEQYFFDAEKCFISARSGGFPNAYAYHAHAYMFYRRGLSSTDLQNKVEFFSESLKILDLARDNANTEEIQIMIELQTLIFENLGRSAETWESIRILAEEYQSAKGYFLYANWISREGFGNYTPKRNEILQNALKVIEEGLDLFPNDVSLLMLNAKILKELAELPDYYNALVDWYRSTRINSITPSLWLLSEYAVTSFKLGFYDQSKQIFQVLNSLSVGHRLVFKAEKHIENDDGTRKKFEGTITRIKDYNEGEIKVDSLPGLRYNIRFRPHMCYFTPSVGDYVIFKIAFTYVSPLAVELDKL